MRNVLGTVAGWLDYQFEKPRLMVDAIRYRHCGTAAF